MRRHVNRRLRSEEKREGGNPWVIGFISLIIVGIIFMAVTSENVDPKSMGKAFEPNVFVHNQVIPEDHLLSMEIADAKLEHVMYLVENSNANFDVKLAVKKELLDVQALAQSSCQTE